MGQVSLLGWPLYHSPANPSKHRKIWLLTILQAPYRRSRTELQCYEHGDLENMQRGPGLGNSEHVSIQGITAAHQSSGFTLVRFIRDRGLRVHMREAAGTSRMCP